MGQPGNNPTPPSPPGVPSMAPITTLVSMSEWHAHIARSVDHQLGAAGALDDDFDGGVAQRMSALAVVPAPAADAETARAGVVFYCLAALGFMSLVAAPVALLRRLQTRRTSELEVAGHRYFAA